MQTPKIVSDYLDAAVPKGLTESRRKLLSDELESHIYDKAEHYIEIGYSEEESFEKAVADMGDAEAVSESFCKLYKESHAVNILIMVLLIGINAVASFANLGGNMVESMPDPNFMIVMLSLGYFSAVVLLIKYAYRRKQTNKLAAVGASMLIVSIPSFFIGTVFVPGGYAVTENLLFILEKLTGTDCMNRFENHFTIPYILFTLGTPVVLSVISFILSLKSICYESKKRFRLPSVGLKAASVILFLFTFANAVIFPFARDYQYDLILTDQNEISRKEAEYKTLHEIYSKINKSDKRDSVGSLFEKNGMLTSDKFLSAVSKETAELCGDDFKKEIK
ncbi:MAG: permease prefix domain 1-containing protein, partial [Acutalibacteraceae bacterium]